MPPPVTPKIYHIVHVDRLPSIIADGCLWCDEEITRRVRAHRDTGTTIGMSSIKQRRLTELALDNHPGLYVGPLLSHKNTNGGGPEELACVMME